MRLIVASVATLMIVTHAALAQQITTGTIQGTVTDATGASLPGVTVEARNIAINLASTQVSGERRQIRLSPAAARLLPDDVQPPRFRHARAGERDADGRTGAHPAGSDEGRRCRRNGDGEHDPGRDRVDPHVGGHDLERVDGGIAAHPRPEVRGSAHPDARREHRPGTRWRRNHVCRTAWDLQQHQPRRRRLQQRLLRRAGRRSARGDRHHARRGQGVSGDRHRRARRVRPHGRRRRQRDHEIGHEPAARHALLLPAARSSDRASCRMAPTSTDSTASSGVGRSAARSAADKAFFFGALEGITGNFTPAESREADRDTPCPVAAPTIPPA